MKNGCVFHIFDLKKGDDFSSSTDFFQYFQFKELKTPQLFIIHYSLFIPYLKGGEIK